MDWLTNKWMAWASLLTEPSPSLKSPKTDEDRVAEELEQLNASLLKGSLLTADGLTPYLQCLFMVVKVELSSSSVTSSKEDLFKWFYQELTPKIFGLQLTEQSWRWIFPQDVSHNKRVNTAGTRKTYFNDEGLLVGLALLADLAVSKLHSLHAGKPHNDEYIRSTVSILRTLSEALNKHNFFQKHHEERDLPAFVQNNPHLFTKTRVRANGGAQNALGLKSEALCLCLKQQNRTSTKQPLYIVCKCKSCQPPESNRWITILLEYFGSNVVCGINGYRELVQVLETVRKPNEVQLDILEVSLHFISVAVEFLKEEVACPFLGPSIDVLRYISSLGGHVPNTNAVGLTVLILKHLKLIFSHLLSPKVAERMIEAAERNLQEQVVESLAYKSQPDASTRTSDSDSQRVNILWKLQALNSPCSNSVRCESQNRVCEEASRRNGVVVQPTEGPTALHLNQEKCRFAVLQLVEVPQ